MGTESDMGSAKDPSSWDRRYAEGTARWDLGAAPPALTALLARLDRPLRVLVPGCGYGHDAIAWAEAGHDVVGVDFAPLAIEGAYERARAAGVEVSWLQADVFAMPDLPPFDAIWEQTCYCAIDVEDRDRYVRAIADVLKPGGRFFGLLWNHGQPGGPPHDVTPEDVRERFAEAFDVASVTRVTESAPTRSNEFFAELVRRG